MARRHYIAKTEDGRYGLTSKGELWKLAGRNSYMAGYVSDRDHIESAADNADEEMRCLMASDYEAEGYTHEQISQLMKTSGLFST